MNKRKIKAPPVARALQQRKSVMPASTAAPRFERPAAQSVVMTTEQLNSLLKYASGSSLHTLGSDKDDTQLAGDSSTTPLQSSDRSKIRQKYDNATAEIPEDAPNFYEGENDVLALRGRDAAQRMTDQMMRDALRDTQFSQRTKNFLGEDLENRDEISLEGVSAGGGGVGAKHIHFANDDQEPDSFLDEDLLNSMRDIATSVSKVADEEMASYFQSIMKSQQRKAAAQTSFNNTKTTHHQTYESYSPSHNRDQSPYGRRYDPSSGDKLNSTFTAGDRTYLTRLSQAQQDYLNEPVHQRLYDTQTVYNQRLEGKKLLRYREETAELKDKPTIAKKSQQMASKMKPIYGRVDGVLGQRENNLRRIKDEVERSRIFQEKQFEEMLRVAAENPKMINQKTWEKKVDLLVRKYRERKKQKEEIKNEQGTEHSFTPEINRSSQKLAGTRKGAIEERLIKTLDAKDKKIKRLSESMTPNFVPSLNQTSMKIMDEKVKVIMTESESMSKYIKATNAYEEVQQKKEQLGGRERILEGKATYNIHLALQDDQQIIEQSPSAEMSEVERRDTWIEENAMSFMEAMDDQSKPSTLNSSIEIINRFRDVILS